MALKLNSKGYESYKTEIESKKKQLLELGKFKGEVAVECGDVWHDNHTFEQVEIQERALIRTINDMTENLKNVIIVDDEKIEKNSIDINNTVTVLMSFVDSGDETEEITVKLVGTASPSNINEVTLNSPLGNAIYHKNVGDKASYEVNNSRIEVEILHVN